MPTWPLPGEQATARAAIDSAVQTELLGAALARGGDYAELYFEHRESNVITYEEQAVKHVGGGVMNRGCGSG